MGTYFTRRNCCELSMNAPNPNQSPNDDSLAADAKADDDRPVGWYVLPIFTTIVCILATPFALVIAWGILGMGGYIWILSFFAALVAVLPLHYATRGGVTLQSKDGMLVRWWGIFFPVVSRRIPYDHIHDVKLSGPVDCVVVSIGLFDYEMHVRTGMRGLDSAQRFAHALAAEVGCPVYDLTIKPAESSPVDTTPPASRRLTLFAIAALLLFWVPVVGLVMLGFAIYWATSLHAVVLDRSADDPRDIDCICGQCDRIFRVSI